MVLQKSNISSAKTEGGYLLKNKVQLIKGGEQFFTVMEDLIRKATATIYLQTYIFEWDDTGCRIAKALIAASRRNVRVNVLLDGYASQNLPMNVIESFHHMNIAFHWFYPLFKTRGFYFGRRLHHKVMVVDTHYVLTGGLNISDRYNDTCDHKAWLDYAVLAEGEIAKAVQVICESRSIFKSNFHGLYQRMPEIREICKIRPRVNDSVNGKRQIWNSHMEMFRKATARIIIMSPYFLPGKTFLGKISESVSKGVAVQLILGGKSDVILAHYAEQYLYQYLLRNKVQIFEYQGNILHGKIATFDGQWVTIGSYNINNISAYASVELNLDIENNHFAGICEGELSHIMQTRCKRLTLENYERGLTWWKKSIQWLAYNFARAILFIVTFNLKRTD
jgi:cardiolipin synthase A/B